MKNNYLITFSLILLLLISASCNTTEPPPPDGEKPTLELTLEDVSCTEAWITLKTTNLQLPAAITLKQYNPNNDSTSQTINLNTQDSLLYIDSLLPNQIYKFHTIIQSSNQSEVKSNEIPVATMDTTSHNFTFETFTFGEKAGGSALYDVAIINENNIWAVGEIYVADTSINGYTMYNAVHWNGQIWELKKIAGHGEYPRRTVFAFSENDVWFDGGIKWDGVSYTVHMSGWPLMPNGDGWQINKMWGSSSNDLYAVGNNGNIAHYNGQSWSKIESGTTVNLYDVWGATDGKTVWACGYSGDYANSVFIRIKDGNTEKIYEGSSNGQSNGYYVGPMSGVWTDNKYRVFLMTGSGIYIQQNSNEFFLEKEIMRFNHGSYGIDGTRSNNIFACGDEFVSHWNGSTYYDYPDLYRQFRTYYNINTKGNVVCVVGTDYSDILNAGAIIALGYK
jgi:hypothetical protein